MHLILTYYDKGVLVVYLRKQKVYKKKLKSVNFLYTQALKCMTQAQFSS